MFVTLYKIAEDSTESFQFTHDYPRLLTIKIANFAKVKQKVINRNYCWLKMYQYVYTKFINAYVQVNKIQDGYTVPNNKISAVNLWWYPF